MPKPGSKPIPRPIAAADGDSLAGSIQQAQSDHAASTHGGKSLPTPNLAPGGHVPAPNAPVVPRPQASDGWGQKGTGVQSRTVANGAAAFGYGFGQGGVNATADAMGDLSVGQKAQSGVGMDGGLGLQFGNFGTGAGGGMGGDFGFGFAGTVPGVSGAAPDASQRDAQQPVNPYGNVYGQPTTTGQSASAKQQAADAVKLPDDLSKDGAGSSGAGAMPAGGVPPYAPYGAMGAYNYMMPPQMAVQVGAEAYGAAYGAYGAAAAAGNGYGGGDGGDYYGRRLGGGSAAGGSQSETAGSVAGGANQPGGDGRAQSSQAGAVGSAAASGSNAPGNAAAGQSTGAQSAGAGAMAGAFSAMPGMGAAGYPYMGYPYMTPGMPPAAGYAVQSPYYGYPQANMYAAAGVYGQQSGASGGGGGKGGKGGYGGYGGGGQRSNYSQPPAPPAPPSSGNGNDSSQFNYYGNYGQSAYGR